MAGDVVTAERLWTHEETAQFLHVSVWRLHHLVTAQAGPARYWVGSQRRYDPVEVRAWLRQQKTEAPTAPSSSPRSVKPAQAELSGGSEPSTQTRKATSGRHARSRHVQDSVADLPGQVSR
ncbi:helix-turn-helix domain-containing protein [Kineosporia sp. NBRC 101731]|uniref:helix-turn-helix domain-containing protein n=1 Tax=Kineosporia sp. NBRC 101731 TaxID=3032199 RepID=UPI0024A46676|nr:helix-turn-helix domain-containing protein [Kineosporia sp. NBRC 101731]GLY33415.1 hypothetical protein Kisp02_67800 [Kineosporia sp. NBRC 101731]